MKNMARCQQRLRVGTRDDVSMVAKMTKGETVLKQ